MAGFLDNSGDIILDAVITDVGRKRLSEGNFRIAQFALGDDEIGYNLYNKNHPSGSAYYDLEILQTPVFQGMTQANANINYGLLSNTDQQLLYLPTLVLNEKAACDGNLRLSGSVLNFAVNPETYTKLITNDPQAAGNANAWICPAGKSGVPNAVTIESGLNTTDLKGTNTNQSRYLGSPKNLIDRHFHVYCDSRFIKTVLGPNVTVQNNFDNNNQTFSPLNSILPGSSTLQLSHYNTFVIQGITDMVQYDASQTQNVDTEISALAGPRGGVTRLNLGVDAGLMSLSSTPADDKWVKYGTNVGIGAITYNSIQTMVYVVGMRSSATLQLSVRLLRYVSG